MDIALARILLSITFGIIIGLIMAYLFREQEAKRAAQLMESGLFDQKPNIRPAVWVVFLLLLAVLIVGTLQVRLLTATWLMSRTLSAASNARPP